MVPARERERADMLNGDIVGFASDRLGDWANLWYLYLFTVASLVTGTVAYRETLDNWRAGGILAIYLIFFVGHSFHVLQYYHMFDSVMTAARQKGGAVEVLVASLAPPPLMAVGALYVLTAFVLLCGLYRQWRLASRRAALADGV